MARGRNAAPQLVSIVYNLGKSLVAWADSVSTAIFDVYSPERHYMRGPGPKSHRKNETPRVWTSGNGAVRSDLRRER
jgi:hypothetical protein